MKTFIKIVILLLISPIFSLKAMAATLSVGEGSISATIDAAPSLYFSQRSGDTLSFGSFYTPNSEGTVTISSNGSMSSTGGVIFVAGSGKVGVFDVVGSPNTTYQVSSVPDTTLNVSSGDSMIATITVMDDSLVGGSTFKLDSLGKDTFKTIGTISVNKKNADGIYNALYPITIFP